MIEIDSDYKELVPPQDYSDCNIDTIDFCTVSYNNFFKHYMVKNVPCIVRNISCEWECSNLWIKDNQIDHDYILNTYGDIEAPVADCDNINYNAHCKCNMKVSEYINYLRNKDKDKTLYLKDWHLRQKRPNDKFYHVPFIFGSDWLNEYAEDTQEDDFMFVYIGPSKSWTPFHADVYSSYSWSVNIYGKKKWILLPPNEEEKLKDSLGNLPLLFDPEKYQSIKYFEIIQERGDAIFVPSGWHHQKNLISVEEEIQEFKETPEFQQQCQLILKSVFGMDFTDFLNFITHIAQKRLNQLNSGCFFGFSNYCLGVRHIMFDLNILLKIIKLVLNHPLLLNKVIATKEIDNIVNIKEKICLTVCICE